MIGSSALSSMSGKSSISSRTEVEDDQAFSHGERRYLCGPDGETLRLRLRLRIFLSLEGSSLRDASSASNSSFWRSLMVNCGPFV